MLLPAIGTLYPPFYASDMPQWNGVPFFYWYLFMWVILSAVLTAVVYLATER